MTTRVGIIGAGQLGQMLGFAAQKLDIACTFLDPAPAPPAALAGPVLQFAYDSEEGLARLVESSDVITFEFENVPVSAAEQVAVQRTVFPPPDSLRHAQDRLAEKQLFASLGIPLPGYRRVDSIDDGDDVARSLGFPVVLKTRRLGYDGKGQAVVHNLQDLRSAIEALGGCDLIAEQCVDFDCEVSAIGARHQNGSVVFYPLTQNEHRNGILNRSRAPFVAPSLTAAANQYLQALLERLDYVGVLALELFVCGDGLLANEFAPRVHNSGHWTIEGAATSQFENHLRAVTGMPLGTTSMSGNAGMLNIIGHMPSDRSALEGQGSFLHDYGKAPRPGRKLGHITVTAGDADSLDEALARLGKLLIS